MDERKLPSPNGEDPDPNNWSPLAAMPSITTRWNSIASIGSPMPRWESIGRMEIQADNRNGPNSTKEHPWDLGKSNPENGIHSQEWNSIPKLGKSNPRNGIHSQEWNSIPKMGKSNPRNGIHSQEWNSIAKCFSILRIGK